MSQDECYERVDNEFLIHPLVIANHKPALQAQNSLQPNRGDVSFTGETEPESNRTITIFASCNISPRLLGPNDKATRLGHF
jgi:hypothetical protein